MGPKVHPPTQPSNGPDPICRCKSDSLLVGGEQGWGPGAAEKHILGRSTKVPPLFPRQIPDQHS